MGTICLDSLLLQGPIQFKSVSKLSFSIKGNEHGHLVVTGFLDEDREFCVMGRGAHLYLRSIWRIR